MSNCICKQYDESLRPMVAGSEAKLSLLGRVIHISTETIRSCYLFSYFSYLMCFPVCYAYQTQLMDVHLQNSCGFGSKHAGKHSMECSFKRPSKPWPIHWYGLYRCSCVSFQGWNLYEDELAVRCVYIYIRIYIYIVCNSFTQATMAGDIPNINLYQGACHRDGTAQEDQGPYTWII